MTSIDPVEETSIDPNWPDESWTVLPDELYRKIASLEAELTLEKQRGEAYRTVVEAATIHIRLSDAYRGVNTDAPRPKMVDVVQSREDLREALRISQGDSK